MLLQVRRLMDSYRAIVIGRRFPIVLVTVGKSQLEVSSFSTNAEDQAFPMDANAILGASGKVRSSWLCRAIWTEYVGHLPKSKAKISLFHSMWLSLQHTIDTSPSIHDPQDMCLQLTTH